MTRLLAALLLPTLLLAAPSASAGDSPTCKLFTQLTEPFAQPPPECPRTPVEDRDVGCRDTVVVDNDDAFVHTYSCTLAIRDGQVIVGGHCTWASYKDSEGKWHTESEGNLC